MPPRWFGGQVISPRKTPRRGGGGAWSLSVETHIPCQLLSRIWVKGILPNLIEVIKNLMQRATKVLTARLDTFMHRAANRVEEIFLVRRMVIGATRFCYSRRFGESYRHFTLLPL